MSRSSIVTFFAVSVLLAASLALAEQITVEFKAAEPEINDVENGEIVVINGFGIAVPAGAPMVPSRIFNIALPPDVVWDSISLSVVDKRVSTLQGEYDIAPGPPARTWFEGKEYVDWGDAGEIVDGKDMDIYGQNSFWPESNARMLTPSQMRKWKFARVEFWPVRYNPVTRTLNLCTSIKVKLDFSRDPKLIDQKLLRDTVMDGLAAEMFVNYRTAKDWYRLSWNERYRPMQTTYDYVIITTEAIRNNSSKLSTLVTHLGTYGYSVLVVTEQNSYGDGGAAGGYGSKTGQSPNGTAEKIRQWLKDNYGEYNITYVLLIGDPHPSSGDVPMKMCWPRRSEGDYPNSPTDYFYADLTGNWDLDGDTYYGEHQAYPNGDRGTGGVDFTPEVYVGRIPVYSDNYSTLDAIIQKVIDYETAGGNLSWRLSALLPESFVASDFDGSYYGRAMESEFLQSRGFSTWEMYERRGSGCYSHYTPDQGLVGGAVKTRWSSHHYGMVWWLGHGSSSSAVLGYSSSGTCDYETLFSTSDCSSLDDTHPAFTYQASCLNGYPESSSNLGYSLLKHGAIGTVSASRVSWGEPGFNSSYSYGGLQYIGYRYAYRLSDYGSYGAGDGLYLAKASLNHNYSWEWMNMFDFNLYGCPHTRLYGDRNTYVTVAKFEAVPGRDGIELRWTTGAEIDNAGFIIYRASGEGGNYIAISELIEAKGTPAGGASYTFVDTDVRLGVEYAYWLVDIDLNGTWTAHGPVWASLPSPADVVGRVGRGKLDVILR